MQVEIEVATSFFLAIQNYHPQAQTDCCHYRGCRLSLP